MSIPTILEEPPLTHSRKGMTVGNSILCVGPFSDDWAERTRRIIEHYSKVTHRQALVLLPHDIQREEYAPDYAVVHGDEADDTLLTFLTEAAPTSPYFLFIDLSPEPRIDDDCLLRTLNLMLADYRPKNSLVVVCAPVSTPLNPAAFDHRLRF